MFFVVFVLYFIFIPIYLFYFISLFYFNHTFCCAWYFCYTYIPQDFPQTEPRELTDQVISSIDTPQYKVFEKKKVWLPKKLATSVLTEFYSEKLYFVWKKLWPSGRKNCSSDREKLLKFVAEGREFAKFLRSLEQFIQAVKVQNNFW